MIDLALRHIADTLNQHLVQLFYLDHDIVTVSSIGAIDEGDERTRNRLLVSLINIREDTRPTRASQARQASARMAAATTSAPLCLNLGLLIAANFDAERYQESLKFISYTIGYFQNNPVFTPANAPALEGEIDQIAMEIENLDMEQWYHLWRMSGSRRALPAVLFQARMLAYDETQSGDYLTPQI